MSEAEICAILRRAPRFDSIAHAVYWLRWHAGFDKRSYTEVTEPLIGYTRRTEHVEIHLAEIYAMAEIMFREQNSYGI